MLKQVYHTRRKNVDGSTPTGQAVFYNGIVQLSRWVLMNRAISLFVILVWFHCILSFFSHNATWGR
jgi:hypothetical protein